MAFPVRSSTRSLLLTLSLVAAIVAAYAVALRGDFLWDDDLHITENPTIIGPLGLKEIWTTARANYFPLVLTNFWVQHALWGLNPLGYHVVTLVCHAIAALLLWRVLLALRIRGAWLGAAIWALHPVQVESVAWICELKNTQSAVFFLAAILFWIRWLDVGRGPRDSSSLPMNDVFVGLPLVGTRSRDTRDSRDGMPTSGSPTGNKREFIGENPPNSSAGVPRLRMTGADVRPRPAFYALSLFCALLAILSKPSTVMLPIALALCAWWMGGSVRWRALVPLVPFFALSGIAAGWTIWEQKFHSGAIGAEWSQTFPERIAIAGRVVWFYLGKLIWPEPLIFIYPRWKIDAAQPIAYVGVVAAIVALFLLWRGRNGVARPALFAAAYFVALLFPVLGFFSVYFFRYSFVGDHFQYLASVGPLALIGATVARLTPRLVPVAGAALVVALGLLTARQSRAYLNPEALWRDTVTKNPVAVMAWLNLADTFAQAQRHDEAIATFRHALSLRPDDPYALNDLGCELTLTGKPVEAIPLFQRSLEVKPNNADAHNNLGNALRAVGRLDEAVANYRRALELDPNFVSAMNNLGAELADAGKPEEALTLFERARRLKPEDPTTLDNVGSALRHLGRFDEAIARHREALRLKPDYAEAHVNLARTLVAAGRVEEALPSFERGLQLRPTLGSAHSYHAMALAALGRHGEAFARLERGVELAPNSAEAQLNLGTALAQSGRTEEAVTRFEAALRIAPNFAAAHANLGTAYLALRRWPQAVTHLDAAAKAQPDSATTRAQLAGALAQADRLADSVPHFEAALRLDPRAIEVHDNFAQVLNALGRRREAFEHFEEAARLRREKGR